MRKKIFISVLAALALSATGCNDTGHQADNQKHQVMVSEYEKIAYEYTEVVRGDISPVLSLKLESDDIERKSYFPFKDEMEVAQVYVEKGDMVSAGDVLISFESGDISEQLKGYESKLEEIQLLIDHYTRLSAIDSTVDYTNDLKNLRKDMEVTGLYISELNAKLDSYSIKAEATGMVFLVSELLAYGTVNATDNVVTVIYGSGNYTAVTTDDYDFKVGDVYTATYGVTSYEMELISIEEDGKDVNGDTKRLLTFRFVNADTVMSESDNLNIKVQKPVLKDVLYVPEETVFSVEDKSYVYLLDENGFRHAAEVKTGSTVDGNTVIESGLQEGDKVVIKR